MIRRERLAVCCPFRFLYSSKPASTAARKSSIVVIASELYLWRAARTSGSGHRKRHGWNSESTALDGDNERFLLLWFLEGHNWLGNEECFGCWTIIIRGYIFLLQETGRSLRNQAQSRKRQVSIEWCSPWFASSANWLAPSWIVAWSPFNVAILPPALREPWKQLELHYLNPNRHPQCRESLVPVKINRTKLQSNSNPIGDCGTLKQMLKFGHSLASDSASKSFEGTLVIYMLQQLRGNCIL
jgi:hypothetical protein